MLEEGADVFVMGSTEIQVYSNQNGHSVRIDAGVTSLLSSIFDAVIVPGCYSSNWMSQKAVMLDLIERALSRGDVVGMLCNSNWLPISKKILNGRKMTSARALKPEVLAAGAKWVDRTVVEDGNLISSQGREDLEAFSQAIISHLTNKGEIK